MRKGFLGCRLHYDNDLRFNRRASSFLGEQGQGARGAGGRPAS